MDNEFAAKTLQDESKVQDLYDTATGRAFNVLNKLEQLAHMKYIAMCYQVPIEFLLGQIPAGSNDHSWHDAKCLAELRNG